MIRLEDTVLVRSELLKLRFEDLAVLVRDGFLVEYEHIGYIIGMHLHELVLKLVSMAFWSYLLLEIFQYLLTFLLD